MLPYHSASLLHKLTCEKTQNDFHYPKTNVNGIIAIMGKMLEKTVQVNEVFWQSHVSSNLDNISKALVIFKVFCPSSASAKGL